MDKRIEDFYLGRLNKEERKKFLQDVFSDDALKKEAVRYGKTETLLSLSHFEDDNICGEREYKKFIHKVNLKKRKATIFLFMKYAAVVVLFVATTLSLYIAYSSQSHQAIASLQQVSTPPGQRAVITLYDGTKVWLNSNSTLTYPTSFGKERRVKLTGEAIFDVAKDSLHPFIVSSQLLDVTALGTSFNVSAYKGAKNTSVYLIRGKVRVNNPLYISNGIVLNPKELLTLENGKATVTTIDNDNFLLWKDGFLVFNNANISDIAEKLESYYDVKIVISTPSILNYKYTGSFRESDGLMAILDIISRIHNFKITVENNIIHLN